MHCKACSRDVSQLCRSHVFQHPPETLSQNHHQIHTAPSRSEVNSPGKHGHIQNSTLDQGLPFCWHKENNHVWRRDHVSPGRKAIGSALTIGISTFSRPKLLHDFAHSACHSVDSDSVQWCWFYSGHMQLHPDWAWAQSWIGNVPLSCMPGDHLTARNAELPIKQIVTEFHLDVPVQRWKWLVDFRTWAYCYWKEALHMASLEEEHLVLPESSEWQ